MKEAYPSVSSFPHSDSKRGSRTTFFGAWMTSRNLLTGFLQLTSVGLHN
uniref:Uncharacterized protein n=1 Tax=Rhizophora mucronata TaxID=61149 RepID=A0A2P2JLL5_RHIMU